MRATPVRCLLALLGLPLVAGFGGLSWVRTAGDPAADGTFTQPATVRLTIADEIERSFRERIAQFADDDELADDSDDDDAPRAAEPAAPAPGG